MQRFDFQLEVIFAPLPEWFDEKGNQIYIPNESETRTMLDEATVELILPYFENAKKIDIYDKNNELKLSIDVSGFAKDKGIVTPQITKQKLDKKYLFAVPLLLITKLLRFHLKAIL